MRSSSTTGAQSHRAFQLATRQKLNGVLLARALDEREAGGRVGEGADAESEAPRALRPFVTLK